MSTQRTSASETKGRAPRRARKSQPEKPPETGQPAAHSPLDPKLYVNRELSLLAFQKRVLEEAQDPGNPLLERVKFLSIFGSNIEEFFMVRVAGLQRQLEGGSLERGPDGMTPKEQLDAIHEEVLSLFQAAHDLLHRHIVPALKKAGLCVVDYAQLNAAQRTEADKYFSDLVFPALTPLAFDPGRPFPHISNLSVNLAVLLRDASGTEHFARVKVPDILPQLVPVAPPARDTTADRQPPAPQSMVWLEQLIVANLQSLFPGMEIIEAHPFHVTRDADKAIQELEAGDLMESVEEGLWERRFADVVRLEVNQEMPLGILEILTKNLELGPEDIYRLAQPLALSRLKHLYAVDRPELKNKPIVPLVPAALRTEEDGEDMFAAIRQRDVLLCLPFASFQPVVTLLQQAAHDPAVLAIKITLYRVGRNSPVVEALLTAAREGKLSMVCLG
jgi:polyphosphate kinase